MRSDGTPTGRHPPAAGVSSGEVLADGTPERTGAGGEDPASRWTSRVADRVRDYMNTFLSMYPEDAGPPLFGTRGVTATLSDSIEVGAQNWTDDILDQFTKRRGY